MGFMDQHENQGMLARVRFPPHLFLTPMTLQGVVIGWISQFGAMPLMAYGLSKAFDLDPFVAIGSSNVLDWADCVVV